jgi:hypothetical protein
MTVMDFLNVNLWDKAKSVGLKYEESKQKAESKIRGDSAGVRMGNSVGSR